jgi:hypothetical protein
MDTDETIEDITWTFTGYIKDHCFSIEHLTNKNKQVTVKIVYRHYTHHIV